MSRSRQLKLLGCLVAILAFTVPSTASAAFSSTNKARILYVGDSIAVGTNNVVRWWTQVTGKAMTTTVAHGGTAICDYLDGKPRWLVPVADRLPARVRQHKPHLVILQFWGNGGGFAPCMDGASGTMGSEAYYNRYFWDALNAVNQINSAAAAAGIAKPKILWVRQGPNRDRPTQASRLNDIYGAVAAEFADRTSDAGRDVSLAANPYTPGSRYGWTQFLPCTQFERDTGGCTHPQAYGGVTQLYPANDPIHFAPAGNNRYGMKIASDANRWLGL